MSDVPDDLRTALAERYLLERQLGHGGMATVYLAHDRKHNRRVAVKVLRPELAASIGADRFLKEIEIAANLTHPHILPLHDSGQAGTFLYYVMPYIEGESLRALLNREGTLSAERAVAITLPVADALDYAHHKGVVHRDIKPENILFGAGHPIVADFGIAKALSTAGGVSLTRTGFPLGTPGYMSPEQAAGMRDLDARSDVYSLACVCYEMLIGETPGLWLTDEAVKLGRFVDAAPEHRATLDRLSGSLELVLVRALAMRHELRTATARQFAQALDGARQSRRRYGDEEARAIVHRAAELDAQHPTTEDALTIGTVQRIAGEAGIPADRVREAAGQLERAGATVHERPNPFLGSPTILRFERIVEGEVPESEYPYLVEDIRSRLGDTGQVSTLGRSLAWTSTSWSSGRQMHITVTPRDGRTRIQATEQLRPIAGGIFGGVLGGLGGGGMGPLLAILIKGAHAAEPVIVLGIAGWLSSVYLGSRLLFRGIVRRRDHQMNDLMDHLAEQVGAAASRPDSLPQPRPVERLSP